MLFISDIEFITGLLLYNAIKKIILKLDEQFLTYSKNKFKGIKMKHLFAIISVTVAKFLCLLAFSLPSQAALANKNAFFEQYRTYQTLVESTQDEEMLANSAVNLAKQAKEVFGPTHINTINLTISAANHFRNAKINDKALKLYDEALGMYKNSDENRELDFAGLLIEVLSTQPRTLSIRDQARLSNDLYDILQDYFVEDEPTEENIANSLMMFNNLVEKGTMTRKMRSLLGLSKTLVKLANAEISPKSTALVRANFNVARVAEAHSKKSEAISYYSKVIHIIEQELDYDHPYALVSHARLVSLFESKRNSEEATKHCVAIGKMKPWEDNIEPTPLFRVDPKYPVKYARQGIEGFAVISFDITPYGFVENIKVVEAEKKLFAQESIKVLKKWRYAPKFVNGTATTAKDIKVKMEFTLGSSKQSSLENS